MTSATVKTWLETPFSQEERHIRRLRKAETMTFDENAALQFADPEIAAIMAREQNRQNRGIELIASENFASPAVRAAAGSIMTNKYAEGYPGKRYYNGCAHVDEAEALAIDRACRLFGAEAANVQAHSGSQANMGAYFAILNPGDTVLAMRLDHGGHLTHGHNVNFSGRLYNFVGYGVSPDTEQIDYDEVARLAHEHKPKLLWLALARIRASRLCPPCHCRRSRCFSWSTWRTRGLPPASTPAQCPIATSPPPPLTRPCATARRTRPQRKSAKKIPRSPGIQATVHIIAAKAVCFAEARPRPCRHRAKSSKMPPARRRLAKQGFRVASGGTDNHLMLVDLRPKGTTGKATATALDEADHRQYEPDSV